MSIQIICKYLTFVKFKIFIQGIKGIFIQNFCKTRTS